MSLESHQRNPLTFGSGLNSHLDSQINALGFDPAKCQRSKWFYKICLCFSWTWYLQISLRECLQIWCKLSLGLKDDLIRFRCLGVKGQRSQWPHVTVFQLSKVTVTFILKQIMYKYVRLHLFSTCVFILLKNGSASGSSGSCTLIGPVVASLKAWGGVSGE